LVSVHAKTTCSGVILRSPANGGTTKNLVILGCFEILRGVYPEYTEGLRMTMQWFRMNIDNKETRQDPILKNRRNYLVGQVSVPANWA
jgi:hypothetical protein